LKEAQALVSPKDCLLAALLLFDLNTPINSTSIDTACLPALLPELQKG
jgi:hypothetical protein